MATALRTARASAAARARSRERRGLHHRARPPRAVRRCRPDRDRPPLPGVPRGRAGTLPLHLHARTDRQRSLGSARSRCCRPSGPLNRSTPWSGTPRWRGFRSRSARPRPAADVHEQVPPSLPARTLAASAHLLVASGIARVGTRVGLLAHAGRGASPHPRCARGRLLAYARAPLPLRDFDGGGAASRSRGTATQAGAGAAMLIASGVGVSEAVGVTVVVHTLGMLVGGSIFVVAAAWRTGFRLAPRYRSLRVRALRVRVAGEVQA